ncbi:superoxide dismutase family protein [Undibacterium curvum]|uniref:Superoxide dismutase [Cu-Zn] n=1 Tax=Undibacterium curvum TaxID=2762294 RepID=A0ABR7A6L0_9BURK|nr:superoxide dismutase family protein [Undibacterium curvum]MBC3932536.1 superoxide dismutase family protein [Undibacterium curvum]
MKLQLSLIALLSVAAASVNASTDISLNIVDEKGAGAAIGSISAVDTKYGLVLTPALRGLAPGLHGFHIHQNPNCDTKEKDGKLVPALGAGGHLDPAGSNKHGEPWGDGHLGDLPPLFVDAAGNATQPVLAPRLKLADLAGRSIMVHAGGDNHSDHPAPLGGGGARVACGIVK